MAEATVYTPTGGRIRTSRSRAEMYASSSNVVRR